jgi:uncharacterized membrane protein
MNTDSKISELNAQSRATLAGIASVGAAETLYLTASKLSETPIGGGLCGAASSCNDVLSGPYSTIPFVDIPLSAVAFIGYSIVALLAVTPFFNVNTDSAPSRTTILFISTAMAAFSAYLMGVLALVLHTSCNYCYLSAALSFSMATIAWTQKLVPNPTKALVVTSSSVAISSLTGAFLFYVTSMIPAQPVEASTAVVGQVLAAAEKSGKQLEDVAVNMPPAIKKHSSEKALKIGERLKALDAKMYGAYWCSHCNNQKQLLGIEAAKMFTYIECDKEGFNSETKLCRTNKIPGYPTWEIAGEFFPGEKDFGELEEILNDAEKRLK